MNDKLDVNSLENDDSLDELLMKNEENIRNFIDINEVKTEVQSPLIAAVEQCLPQKTARFKSCRKYIPTRDIWYQSYSVKESYEKDSGPVKVKDELKDYEVDEEISAIEAMNDPRFLSDIRPNVFDNSTKLWTLLDTGSCVSCTPRKPSDTIDPNFKLKAVNGQSIPTYGSEVITVRIGRKQYSIEAIKTSK